MAPLPVAVFLTGILFFALCPEGQTPLPDMYQAEEHSNITITSCQYPSNAAIPPKTLNFDLVSLKPLKKIYAYDSRLVAVRHIDEFFRGRLHCDLLRAREGKIECVLADLRVTDTGQYQCVVHADGKMNLKTYNLTVTASRNQNVAITPEPANHRERFYLFVSLGMFAALCFFFIFKACIHGIPPGSSRFTQAPLAV